MASNKKPSIYSDRGSIGSANELDEYGVWVKSEPQVLSADSADSIKPGDLDDSVLGSVEFAGDEASTGDSLSFDDAVLDVKESSKDASAGFTDIEFPDDNIDIDSDDASFSLDSNLDDLNIPDTELGVPNDDSLQNDDSFEIEDTSFDDFEAPAGDSDELDLDDFSDLALTDSGQSNEFETEDFTVPTVKSIENNIEGVQKDFETVSNNKEGELSTQLLLKIANELSSIRGELSELKKEFSSVRQGAPAADDKSGFFSEEDDETIALTGDELDNILGSTDEPVVQAAAADDDDDDEAIALTGDELDNILNSADFTEESGTNETVENDFSLDDEPEAPQDETEESQDADLSNFGITGEDADFTASTDDDLNLDDDLSMAGGDLDLDADLTANDGDLNLDEDFSVTDDDVNLDTDFTSADDDLNLDTDLTAGDESLDADFAATDDTANLNDNFGIIDDNADLSMDDISSTDSSDDLSLDDDISFDSEISADTAANDEIIDIDTDDLNIDLDPDALLAEGDSLSGNTDDFDIDSSLDTEISIDTEDDSSIDTDFSDMDLGSDIFDDIEKHDAPELQQLRSEGVTPLTSAPENSSYLESEEEEISTDSFDLSDAVIDEPDLSTDGMNDDLVEPSLNDNEFDLDSLDDLTIDSPKEEPVSSKSRPGAKDEDSFDDIDIDIPQDDSFAQQPADEEIDFSSDTGMFEEEETVIPEGFEAEIEEKPIPFDDDLDEDIAANDFNDAFDIPGMVDDDFSLPEAPAPKAVPAPQQAAPKAAPQQAVQQAPAPMQAPAVQPGSAPKAAGEPAGVPQMQAVGKNGFKIPSELKSELRNILSYMDQLLESLPEDKIEEFAKSDYFDSYKKLFKELGLV